MLSGMAVKRTFGAAAEVITLSGTTNPGHNAASDATSDPDPAEAGFRFNTNGTVDKNENSVYTSFQAGTEWSDLQPTPGQDYWIRFSSDSGNDPDTVTMNTWLKVAGTSSLSREATWTQDSAGLNEGSAKVEIAEDSGGSSIVATGFYGGSAEVE